MRSFSSRTKTTTVSWGSASGTQRRMRNNITAPTTPKCRKRFGRFLTPNPWSVRSRYTPRPRINSQHIRPLNAPVTSGKSRTPVRLFSSPRAQSPRRRTHESAPTLPVKPIVGHRRRGLSVEVAGKHLWHLALRGFHGRLLTVVGRPRSRNLPPITSEFHPNARVKVDVWINT